MLVRLTVNLQDARIFYHLESWKQDPTDRSTTVYLNLMQAFEKHNTTVAFKIAGGLDVSSSSSSSRTVKQNAIPSTFMTKISRTFFDSLYGFLDGLANLVSDPEMTTIPPTPATASKASQSIAEARALSSVVDTGDAVRHDNLI